MNMSLLLAGSSGGQSSSGQDCEWVATDDGVGQLLSKDPDVRKRASPDGAPDHASDTAFRIFVPMASRRLNSDRFFTTDYAPRIHTGRARLDRLERHVDRSDAALPEPADRDARPRERLPPWRHATA